MKKIEGFHVNWIAKEGFSDNIDKFNTVYKEFIDKVMEELDAMKSAYWETYSGKIAKENNFSTIEFITGTKNNEGIFNSINAITTK